MKDLWSTNWSPKVVFSYLWSRFSDQYLWEIILECNALLLHHYGDIFLLQLNVNHLYAVIVVYLANLKAFQNLTRVLCMESIKLLNIPFITQDSIHSRLTDSLTHSSFTNVTFRPKEIVIHHSLMLSNHFGRWSFALSCQTIVVLHHLSALLL